MPERSKIFSEIISAPVIIVFYKRKVGKVDIITVEKQNGTAHLFKMVVEVMVRCRESGLAAFA